MSRHSNSHLLPALGSHVETIGRRDHRADRTSKVIASIIHFTLQIFCPKIFKKLKIREDAHETNATEIMYFSNLGSYRRGRTVKVKCWVREISG